MKTLQLHAMLKNFTALIGQFILAGMAAGRFSLDAQSRRRAARAKVNAARVNPKSSHATGTTRQSKAIFRNPRST